ncbi:hypothetical protein [Streptomyces kanasensis]|uniref:hypothetical protein n=1 Tax=Streptomyces kanasensis TaxID=936756 RepID=UPI0012FFA1C9|nr:hypothetical protein [Streptomyces kanasensis]
MADARRQPSGGAPTPAGDAPPDREEPAPLLLHATMDTTMGNDAARPGHGGAARP